MAVKVADKIKQFNNANYFLMDASDVEMSDGKSVESKINNLSKGGENSYKFVGSVYDLDWIKQLSTKPISTNEIPVYKYIGNRQTITQPYNGTPYIITILSAIQSQRWDYNTSMAVDCTMFEIPEDEGIIFYPDLEFTLQNNKCTVSDLYATGNTKDSRKVRIYTKDKLPDNVVNLIRNAVPSTYAIVASPKVTLSNGDNFSIMNIASNAFINKFGDRVVDYYSKNETDSLIIPIRESVDEIKQKAIPHSDISGYPIKLTDCLANETPLKCNVFGCKNLIPYPYSDTTKTVNGITFTDNGDGTITANGTATAHAYFILSGNLTFKSGNPMMLSGCPNGGSSSTFCITTYGTGTDYKDIGNGIVLNNTMTKNIRILIYSGTTVNNLVFKPQLELGTTATGYEPYKKLGDYDSTDLAYKIPIKCCGKNLIPYPYSDTTKTVNGITFTDNGDGTITVNGTATAGAQFKIVATSLTDIDISQKYTISGGLTNVTVYISLYKGTTWKKDIKTNGKGSLVDFPSYTDIEWDRILVFANVPKGYTVDNLVIKPQLELGEVATEYEPYKTPSTVTASLATPLDIDEYIDIVNKKRYKGSTATDITVSGSLKMLDSTANVIMCGASAQPSRVELSYYQDINKVLTNLTNAILAQGGNE